MSSSKGASVADYPVEPQSIPELKLAKAGYSVRFATSPAELKSVQQLRFEVFNLELGEGLEESYKTGRDQDRFDAYCHHLMVLDANDEVIGTYRMQTDEMAANHIGYYSADEFDLSRMPRNLLDNSVEVGRACVAKPFRNRYVLFLLWCGLAAYMTHNRKRYLFGCCSLTSQDPDEGRRVMDYLRAAGHVRSDFRIEPRPDWRCYDAGEPPASTLPEGKIELPKLFSLYLRYGAQVCGPPAIDRCFKTIDYLVVLDVERLGADARKTFFA
ncbi:MAG TPA: GNAT family N-acyltransferase [Candidatus Polarisedimenticolaceae bacterium]|nr:GNAT family N-acyltransferase [Candidatus Polarisedimenticolaceae bacterium]